MNTRYDFYENKSYYASWDNDNWKYSRLSYSQMNRDYQNQKSYPTYYSKIDSLSNSTYDTYAQYKPRISSISSNVSYEKNRRSYEGLSYQANSYYKNSRYYDSNVHIHKSKEESPPHQVDYFYKTLSPSNSVKIVQINVEEQGTKEVVLDTKDILAKHFSSWEIDKNTVKVEEHYIWKAQNPATNDHFSSPEVVKSENEAQIVVSKSPIQRSLSNFVESQVENKSKTLKPKLGKSKKLKSQNSEKVIERPKIKEEIVQLPSTGVDLPFIDGAGLTSIGREGVYSKYNRPLKEFNDFEKGSAINKLKRTSSSRKTKVSWERKDKYSQPENLVVYDCTSVQSNSKAKNKERNPVMIDLDRNKINEFGFISNRNTTKVYKMQRKKNNYFSYLPTFYTLESEHDTTLVFESRFESGNLRKALK